MTNGNGETQQTLLNTTPGNEEVQQAALPAGKPIDVKETAGVVRAAQLEKKSTGFKQVKAQTTEAGKPKEETTESGDAAKETIVTKQKEKKRTRSMGKVTVYRSISLHEHLVALGLVDPAAAVSKADDILIPVTEVVEDCEEPLFFDGVPEACTWVKSNLESGKLPGGDYFVIRLVKKFGATVKQVLQVDMQESDF